MSNTENRGYMSRDQSKHWYDEMQHRDRVIVDAVAEMVRPIEWQLFVTFTDRKSVV